MADWLGWGVSLALLGLAWLFFGRHGLGDGDIAYRIAPIAYHNGISGSFYFYFYPALSLTY